MTGTLTINASGSVVARQRYDAFGNIIAQTGTAPSNYGFSTKPQDQVTGLLYYGYRFYDPETGRWPSRDPIAEEGGINLYGFVGNDGTNNWDYLGMNMPKLKNYVIEVSCKCMAIGSCARNIDGKMDICLNFNETAEASGKTENLFANYSDLLKEVRAKAHGESVTKAAMLCMECPCQGMLLMVQSCNCTITKKKDPNFDKQRTYSWGINGVGGVNENFGPWKTLIK